MRHGLSSGGQLWTALLGCIALSLCLGLTGCSSQGNQSPLITTVDALFPEDVTETARRLPYASVQLQVGGNGGLWILASQTGDTTYWQSRDATLAFTHGYLTRTDGLPVDLIDTQLTGETWLANASRQATTSPLHYTVTRTWQAEPGEMARQSAMARLDCESMPETVVLPLQTLALQRCEETLTWTSGETTHSTVWRSEQDGRIWALTTQPWPDAPIVEWEVARPWW